MPVDTLKNYDKWNRAMPNEQMREDKWFPRNCYPQDIDGELEIDGHFLYFEYKERGATVQAAEWSAASKRLYLMGQRATLFYVYHEDGNDKKRILPQDVFALRIARRDKWLECHADSVKLTEKAISCNWVDLHRWCTEWLARIEERPNSFVTDFRQLGPFKEATLTTPYYQL